MILYLALALETCAAVTGEHITARDAARADARFGRIAPDTILGLSPNPGVRRVLGAAELSRHTELGEPVSICFEYATVPAEAGPLLEALRQAVLVRYPEASTWRFRLIDYARHRVPTGPVRFTLSSIAPNRPDGTLLARGSIPYAEGRSFPVWVHVKIEAPMKRVLARRALTRALPITLADIEERETLEPAPPRSNPIGAAEVAGKMPTRDIAAGTAIEIHSLRTAPQVSRGEPVTVEVVSGLAKLSFEGRAEASGREGDRIAVLNPATGRRFVALVQGARKAVVLVEGRNRP